MEYIRSLIAKKDFVEQLSKIMPDTKAFIESLVIIQRMISLSHRVDQLKHAIIYFGALQDISNNTELPYESHLDYGIYLNYIFVESIILFELETNKKVTNSPQNVFDLVNDYIEKYFVNGSFIIANGAISFSPEHYLKALNEYHTVISNEKVRLSKIKKIRNKYAAHFDLNYSIDSFDFEIIIRAFVALENAWINLAKSMGVIIDSNYMNFDKYENNLEKIDKLIKTKKELLLQLLYKEV